MDVTGRVGVTGEDVTGRHRSRCHGCERYRCRRDGSPSERSRGLRTCQVDGPVEVLTESTKSRDEDTESEVTLYLCR